MTPSEAHHEIERTKSYWESIFEKHFPRDADLATVVLKGHLIIEHQLTTILAHYCVEAHYLSEARLQFHQKVALARAIVLFPFSDDFWGFVRILNQLRNDFSHELEPKKLEAHLTGICGFYDRYQRSSNCTRADEPKDDLEKVKRIISYYIGFLTPLDFITRYMESKKNYG